MGGAGLARKTPSGHGAVQQPDQTDPGAEGHQPAESMARKQTGDWRSDTFGASGADKE